MIAVSDFTSNIWIITRTIIGVITLNTFNGLI